MTTPQQEFGIAISSVNFLLVRIRAKGVDVMPRVYVYSYVRQLLMR